MAKHPLMNKTIIGLLVLLVIMVTATRLHEQYNFIPDGLSDITEFLFFLSLSFLITSIIVRLSVDWVSGFFGEDAEQKLFYSKLYGFLLYTIAIFIVLNRIGFSLDNITLILGFLATGFAFAVRDVLISFLVWFILLTKRPFRIGDYIKIGDDEGKVIHVGTFFVLIDDTPDSRDDYTRIPNRIFLEKPVHNFGRKDVLGKVTFPLSRLPKDIDSRLEKIKKELAPHGAVLVNLDLKDMYYCLDVMYRAPYQKKKEYASKILKILAKGNSDIGKEF